MSDDTKALIATGVIFVLFIFFYIGYSIGKNTKTIYKTIEKCNESFEDAKYRRFREMCPNGIKKYEEHYNFPIVECK